MPEIMRQYGSTIVVAISASLLMTLLFIAWRGEGGSVITDAGAQAGIPVAERSVTGAGTAGFAEHSSRSVPRATVNGPVVQGVELDLLGHFTITDSDGATWSSQEKAFVLDGAATRGVVRVTSITSTDGTEHVSSLVKDSISDRVLFSHTTGLATFLEPGVYRVKLSVLDHDNVSASYTIPLVVDFALGDEPAPAPSPSPSEGGSL